MRLGLTAYLFGKVKGWELKASVGGVTLGTHPYHVSLASVDVLQIYGPDLTILQVGIYTLRYFDLARSMHCHHVSPPQIAKDANTDLQIDILGCELPIALQIDEITMLASLLRLVPRLSLLRSSVAR